MPRSIVIGNGNVLVAYDATYSVRDLFFPHVGKWNHTVGNLCRTGFFVDGKFSWLHEAGWERTLGYLGDALVTDVVLRHHGLGIEVRCNDYVDMARDYLIRNLLVTCERDCKVGRVFFHYDWYIQESDLGSTVLYDPLHRAVIAYKHDCYFLVGGQSDEHFGISSWATGKKGLGAAGTWLDAEDGELGQNPIEQGSVDCTIALDFGPAAAGQPQKMTHWVCMGKRLQEITTFGQDLIHARGENNYRTRTRTYWDLWFDKEPRHVAEEIGDKAHRLYRRSLVTIRSHADNRGGIIASGDFDITKFARDTYAYVWPRDAALVTNALDRGGHEDVTRQFFLFARQVMTEEGYFLHKYTTDGQPGSSWHPWVDKELQRVLPIQEDETGLVLWALWEHYSMHRNLDFAVQLYSSLVEPAATWLAEYFDRGTGLPRASWDLWEERWGVHAYTVGAVYGGLKAAHNFALLFADEPHQSRYEAALRRLKATADDHLYRAEMGRFARRVALDSDGALVPDPVLDSAICGLWRFGMYPADDPKIVQTMHAIRDQLSVKAGSGGVARYTNDYYFQVEKDAARVPGNPWFICTLWLAQWYIAVAGREEELKPARDIIDWVVDRQVAGGLLSEQLDPNTGAPLSVSPLTWSHAEMVVTVDDYVRKLKRLRRQAAEALPAATS